MIVRSTAWPGVEQLDSTTAGPSALVEIPWTE
jgi:hypothetical protein